MNKIQKLSRFFKRVFWVIFFGWPICLALIWFGDQQHGLLSHFGFSIKTFIPNSSVPVPTDPSFTTRSEGFLLSLIPAGLGMASAYFFIKLFSCYELGEIFTIRSVHLIKKVGMLMIAWAILNPFYQLAISFILTMHNPYNYAEHHPGWEIALTIDTDYVRNLIVAGLVFLIAYIMQEALKLHEDQSLTV